MLLSETNALVAIEGICGLGLNFTYSGFRGLYGALTIFAWIVTLLFSKEYMKGDKKLTRYLAFNLATLIATLGIFFATDFFTVFVFFELMSLTSFMWVLHRETKEAFYAAGTYLAIAIAGGLAILMGIFLVWNSTHTLMFDELYVAAQAVPDKSVLYVAAGCMFVGFGAKASAFPVHVWLPMSYTEAPAPATALLSAILSKTGIFGLLMIAASILPMDQTWGGFLLLIGTITMVAGGLCGLCNDNLKTTIAYSSMSQIGFILVGTGMINLLQEENALAVRGTILHMVNHTLVKLLLFMIAGIVFKQVGSYELNKVRGFGQKKPFLMVSFLAGAAGVGGIPLLNGYISKTLLHESIVEYQNLFAAEYFSGMKWIEYLFLFSGGLTLAYMTKLFIVLFVEKNQDEKVQSKFEKNTQYMGIYSKICLAVCIVPILLIGLLPHVIADPLMDHSMELLHVEEFEEKIAYFSLANLSGALVSIIVAVIMYIIVVRGLMLHTKKDGYQNPIPTWFNMEQYLYRKVFYQFIPFLICVVARILDCILDAIVVFLRKTVYKDRPLPYELPEGTLFTHELGLCMEFVEKNYEKLTHHKAKQHVNYEHKVVMKRSAFFEYVKIIERSLSFGLFMFCVGLALTLIYLLAVN